MTGELFLAGELHQDCSFLTEFVLNDIIIFLGPLARSPTLDNLVLQNSARPLSFLRHVKIAFGIGIFGIRISMPGPVIASQFIGRNWIGRLRTLRELLLRSVSIAD